MTQRVLWQEYGIPASLSYDETRRALRLHSAECQREQNLREQA